MASSLVEKMLSGLPLSGGYARVGITRLAPTRPLESIVASGAGVLIGAVSYCNRHRGASISRSWRKLVLGLYLRLTETMLLE